MNVLGWILNAVVALVPVGDGGANDCGGLTGGDEALCAAVLAEAPPREAEDAVRRP